MTRKRISNLLIGLLALAGLASCGGPAAGPKIEVEGAWARPSPQMAGAGAAYMVLKNKGNEADRLLSAETPMAEAVELHESFMDENDVMKMRPLEGGAIEVPAGGQAELKPGGMHIMLINLAEPLKTGTTIPLTLSFEKSGKIEVEVAVSEEPPGG
jgi:copper(I)-binding protein